MFSRLISLMLFITALVLSILACILPDWLYAEDGKKYGIWLQCDKDKCEPVDVNGSTTATKILSIITCISILIVIILGIRPAFSSRSTKLHSKNNVPFYFGVLSTILALVTIILNTTSTDDTKNNIRGAAFYLEILTAATAVIGSILIFNPIKVILIN